MFHVLIVLLMFECFNVQNMNLQKHISSTLWPGLALLHISRSTAFVLYRPIPFHVLFYISCTQDYLFVLRLNRCRLSLHTIWELNNSIKYQSTLVLFRNLFSLNKKTQRFYYSYNSRVIWISNKSIYFIWNIYISWTKRISNLDFDRLSKI